MYNESMTFEWDEAKNERNKAKHGVSTTTVMTLDDIRKLRSSRADVFRSPACPDGRNHSAPDHVAQHELYRRRAHVGENLADVRLRDGEEGVQDGRLYPRGLGNLVRVDDGKTGVQFGVAFVEHRQKILHERNVIVPVFVPVLGGLPERLVVPALFLVYLLLERDVFASVIAVLVQEEE